MSNLLDKSSILLTPTAYDNGKILSVKPAPGLGSELIANGDFENGSTDWILNPSSGTTIVSNGKLNFTNSSSGGTQVSQRDRSYVIGKTYEVTYTVTDYIQGDVKLSIGNNLTTSVSANGTFTQYITYASGLNRTYIYTGNSTLSIDNISIKEAIDGDFDFTRNSSATRVNSQGLIEDITSNLPRIDYTGGVGHWLFEPSSTNLLTYSEDFATGWTKFYLTLTAESTTSPDGSLTGTKVQITNDNTAGLLTNNIAITSGLTYTQTVYAKAGTYGYLHMTGSTGFNSSRYQSYDLVNGVLINGSGGIESSIENVGNGWYRCTYTDVSILSASGRIVIGVSNNSGRLGGSGLISGDNIYLWGAQLEVGSFSTSYIPTTTTQVTRLQDAATGAGSSDLINSTEGVLYAETSALTYPTTPNNWMTITDGTAANSVGILFEGNSVVGRIEVGGVTQAFISVNIDYSNFIKVAFKYKENNFSFWVNGVKIGADASGVTFPLNTLNSLQFTYGAGSNKWTGKTKCLAVFKEALTDAELTCLTTI